MEYDVKMKIIITEQMCKDICKKIKLRRSHRTYKKTLEEYYKRINNKEEFYQYVLNMIGYNT